MTHEELIAKLEAATEGSQELNGEIWAIVEPEESKRRASFKGLKHVGSIYTKAEKRAYAKFFRGEFSPRYTTSLDAALTIYKHKPHRMPINPLTACAEALRQWL